MRPSTCAGAATAIVLLALAGCSDDGTAAGVGESGAGASNGGSAGGAGAGGTGISGAGGTSAGSAGVGQGGGAGVGGDGGSAGSGAAAGVAFPPSSPSYTPIIPGAAGFGFDWTIPATWHVYHITSLSTGSEPGTYRDCVTGTWTGLRICVFDVSGTITFPTPTPNGTIIATTNPNLIEAWQTAPDPGILIVNAKRTYRASNVLVWHAALMNDKPFLTADGYSANSGSLFEFNGAGPAIENAICMNCTGMFASDEPFSTWKETNGASYYQSLSGWNSDVGGGHGSLFAGDGPVSVIRSVFVNNKIRNPRFADLAGEVFEAASLNNVAYNWQGRGLEMSRGFQVNAEGNYFIKGPEGVVSGAVVVDNASEPSARLYFASSNRGMGGVADPPAVNNQADDQIIAGARMAGSYPAGYELLDTSSVSETEGVELVMACAGARPLDRLPIAQALLDHVLAGTGSLVDGPNQVGGVPDLAHNTAKHADLPAESGTAASFDTIKAWLKEKSDALLPPGRGCN